MKKIIPVFAFLAATAFIVGCASDGASTSTPPSESAVQFVWFDDTSPRSVSCTGVQLGKTADGRSKVTAHLKNREYSRIEVQANCVFLDAQGFTVDESPFRTVILDETATEDVVFESFNTNAVKYLVRVRKSR